MNYPKPLLHYSADGGEEGLKKSVNLAAHYFERLAEGSNERVFSIYAMVLSI